MHGNGDFFLTCFLRTILFNLMGHNTILVNFQKIWVIFFFHGQRFFERVRQILVREIFKKPVMSVKN